MLPWLQARPWTARHLVGLLLVALIYFLVSQLGLAFVTLSNVSPLWPPSGVALAIVILCGRKYLPGVFVGVFIAGLGTDVSWAVAGGEAVANTLFPLLGSLLLERFGFHPSLSRLKDVLALGLGAGLACSLPSAVIGVGSLYAGGNLTATELPEAIRIWWLGDLLGVVGVSPILFVFSVPKRLEVTARCRWELAGHAVLLVLACQYVFGSSYAVDDAPWLQPFVLMPLTIWAALRFGSRGAALESAFLSAVSVWAATSGTGALSAWPVDDAVVVAQVFICMTATTALALAATASERENARLRAELLVGAVNRSPDGLIILDAKLAIVFVNPSVGEALGYAPSELVGKRLDIANGPLTDEVKLVAAFEECQKGKPARVNVVQYRKDGSHFDCESTITAELGPAGAPLRYICSYRDVTERNQLQAKLASQERLASVGTLAAGVAHEINNPLTYLMLNLEALRTSPPGVCDGAQAKLGDALDAAERIRVIVRDLRALTEARTSARPVKLSEVVRSALKVAHAQLSEVETLHLELDEAVWSTASEALLGQVVLNLVTNAVQACSGNARSQVAIRARAEGEFSLLEVGDNGIGIPKDVLPRIFEPFFTTKPIGEGTGLGLYVCHRVVEQLGGDIAVESRPGEGTRFRVRIPRADPERLPAPVTSPAMPRLRLFLVDDDARLVTSMRLLLQEHHDVVTETRPEAAEERLKRGEHFDAILCDLQMPTLSGMELYGRISRQRPEVAERFMFMSGGAFTPEARRFVDTTPQPVLEKPVRAEALLERLAGFCERRVPQKGLMRVAS